MARDPRRPGRTGGRSWWAWALVAGGLLWSGLVGVEAPLSYPATATVTSGDTDLEDGSCPVVWEGPARTVHVGESDCTDDPPATTIDVLVSTWLAPGEPVTAGLLVGMACVLGLPPVVLGGWRLLVLRDRRRAPAAEWPSPAELPDFLPDTSLPI